MILQHIRLYGHYHRWDVHETSGEKDRLERIQQTYISLVLNTKRSGYITPQKIFVFRRFRKRKNVETNTRWKNTWNWMFWNWLKIPQFLHTHTHTHIVNFFWFCTKDRDRDHRCNYSNFLFGIINFLWQQEPNDIKMTTK